ncbi:MAG: hypothetical protein COA94_00850 [Rickettsiales bacterium]|nr:MAG: hypothetical protein COA94_00850 [Rickettsiales bacterium]
MPNTDKILARIKLLKYLFLSAGICVLIGILATIYGKDMFDSSHANTNSTNSLALRPKLSKNHTLSINHSIFEGVSKDLTPYKIIAENVTRNSDNKYQLNRVEGDCSLKAGGLKMRAAAGTIDMSTKLVTLKQDVYVTLNENTIFNSDEIQISLNNKDISSNSAVSVTLKDSNIKADKFKALGSSDDIKFEGNIKFESDVKSFSFKATNK